MANHGAEHSSYILFVVAGTTYGIRSVDVQHMEIVEQVTPVPNAPPFVDGVALSRGEVVPVMNLRARFGFERMERGLRSRLLVVGVDGRRVGLLADEAREFVNIAAESIQPPNEAVTGLNGNYLDGIATLGGRIVMILNVRELIASPAPVA